ncbi:unnamed protein product [Didymodactylos carnosus]|uniref:MULE transposase domain-containing protein n=1 Tax=Didymodactylos carnosus TaxID=1234261 RepID=A0A814HUI4_9BILA|nr:unnamed protein product [Didymodactylos carnosus]CAF1015612.1 unnamed protein product [Didymodactylos carnosus]CAF3563375.1 unnamed protein product [Didymodactylos carnosus]CAF3787194.1 unnamed protein product [Didymodactylos carnosus]
MDTNFTWSKTQRGEIAILYNSYLYHLKRVNQNVSSVYACTFKSCYCAITLKNDAITKSIATNHNHDSKLTDNVQIVLIGLKRRVLNDANKLIPKIYDEERRENGIAATVFDARKSTLYSIHKTILSSIPTPLSCIVIPQDMYYNNSKEEFSFYNSPTPHKVIAFGSESALKLLSENYHWNADGTFRTSPALFSQAYYIHVWDEHSIKPIVYSCCEDKSQNGYICLPGSLVGYAAQKSIVLNSSSILIDFEKAAINAISDVFPQTLVKGCHFSVHSECMEES